MRITDVEQANKLNNLEEKFGLLANKTGDIDDRLKKIEGEFTAKKDINTLFDKVRKLEETPNIKTLSRLDFIKKAVIAGIAVLITGAIVSVGTIVWKLVINLDTIIEAIEKLRQGGSV